jgi:hypothetical protein
MTTCNRCDKLIDTYGDDYEVDPQDDLKLVCSSCFDEMLDDNLSGDEND